MSSPLLKNVSWLLGARLVSMIVGVASSIVVIRVLGPDQFGVLSAVLALVALLMPLSQGGIDAVLTRELVTSSEQLSEWLSAGWILRVAAAGISTAVASIVFFTIDFGFDGWLLAVTCLAMFVSAPAVSSNIFVARSLFSQLAAYNIAATCIGSSLKIFAVVVPGGVLWVAAANTVQSSVAGLISAFRLRRENIPLALSKPSIKMLATGGGVMLAAQLMSSAYMRLDQLFIASMIGTESLGHYAVSARVVEMALPVPMALITVLTPQLYKDSSLGAFSKLYSLCLVSAFFLAIPMFIFSEQIVSIAFGEEFLASAYPMTILAFSIIPSAIGVAIGRQLVANNQLKFLVFMTFLGLTTNVILNILWIPEFGIAGAAYATLVSYSVAAYSSVLIPGVTGVRDALFLGHKAKNIWRTCSNVLLDR